MPTRSSDVGAVTDIGRGADPNVELTWWAVAIVGCVGLAVCIAAVLLRPMDEERRSLRLLANVGRLTRLPEYRRAARLRTLSAVVAIGLLVVIFGASVVAAARPTGLPAVARHSGSAQPEDIMLCMGGAGDRSGHRRDAAVLR